MDNLPTIELTNNIETPAVEAKTFDKMWVTDFVVRAENASQSSLYAILRPMCSTTGEVLVKEGTEQVVNLRDLFGILEGRTIEPKLTPETIALGGQVMGGVLLLIKSILTDYAKPDPIPDAPQEPVVEDNPITDETPDA